MLKVLIADDEQVICEMIHSLIDWEAIPVSCCGMANNGLVAYEMIQRMSPDIVITDIRMPGMDGLDLVERCRRENLDINFIVISGYSEFDYAKRALKSHVEDYLLKPISESELNMILSKLVNKIQTRMNAELDNIELTTRLENRTGLLRKNELQKLAADPSYPLNTAMFQFSEGNIFFIGLDVDFRDFNDTDKKTAATILENICIRIINFLSKRYIESEMVLDTYSAYVLVSGNDTGGVKRACLLEELVTIAKECMIKYNMVDLAFCVSAPTEDAAEVGSVFLSACNLLDARIWYKTGHLLDGGAMPPQPSRAPSPRWKNEINETSDMLLSLTQKQMSEQLKALFTAVAEQPVRENMFGITLSLMHALRQKAASCFKGSHPEYDRALDTIEEQVESCSSTAQLLSCTEHYVSIFYDRQRNKEKEPIVAAKRYIGEHIGQQITLEEVAAILHFSPTYFSGYFKEKAGINFSDYVIKTRIEKAMEYLRNTEMMVYEIAELVGYTDVKHFSKVFKKEVKVKPTEYRKFFQ